MSFVDLPIKVLKIVGNYKLFGVDESQHDVKNDIFSVVYDDYFYQATISDINPKDNNGNNFSLLVEVPSFQSIELTFLLRTKIDGRDTVLENIELVGQPDDFLSDILEVTANFTHPPQSVEGCTNPIYPNYHCRNRLDDDSCTYTDVNG